MKMPFQFGPFRVVPATGELIRHDQVQRVEPKVMQLLCALAEHAPGVVSRAALIEILWPNSVVTEDALARSLLKLRRALGDDARMPTYIETLPRRGYRLLLPVVPLNEPASSTLDSASSRNGARPYWIALAVCMVLSLLVFASTFWPLSERDELPVLARAHDHYYQFSLADNERAYVLYQRMLEAEPGHAEALAGLANTLVQRVIRWPEAGPEVPKSEQSVAAALRDGRTDTAWAKATLERAWQLVEQASRSAPDNGFVWKAHGLVAVLNSQRETAMVSYEKALEVDPGNWEAALNLGELYLIAGDATRAIELFQRSYRIMDDEYLENAQRIGPWQPELGLSIGQMYQSMGEASEAEAWYRAVLERTPLHVDTTVALASLRSSVDDGKEAEALCRNLISRIGPLEDCQPYLPDD